MEMMWDLLNEVTEILISLSVMWKTTNKYWMRRSSALIWIAYGVLIKVLLTDMGRDSGWELDLWISNFYWVLSLFQFYLWQELRRHEDWDDWPSAYYTCPWWKRLQSCILCSKQVSTCVHFVINVMFKVPLCMFWFDLSLSLSHSLTLTHTHTNLKTSAF